MDLLTVILACSLHWDDDLVRAIAETNSHGNPYAVMDAKSYANLNADNSIQEPRSVEEAVAKIAMVLSYRGIPLLGLMQVPAAWASIYGKQAESLLDPCTNIAVGTARLSEFDYECARRERVRSPKESSSPKPANRSPSRRACIVRKYAEAIGMPELETVVSLELKYQRPAGAGVASVFASPLSDEATFSTPPAWASGRLFFELATDQSALIDPFATDSTAEALPSERLPSRAPQEGVMPERQTGPRRP